MFARRRCQAIGDQYQGALAERHAIAAAPAQLSEGAGEPQFVPEMARGQHRSPVPSRERFDLFIDENLLRLCCAVQQSVELVDIEMCGQQIDAAKIENRPVLGLSCVVAISLDEPQILVLNAFAAGGSNDPQEYRICPKNCPCSVANLHLIRSNYLRNLCPYKITKTPDSH